MDLKESDITFRKANFFKVFVIHTVFVLTGPLLGLILRLWYGRWHFPNNIGLTGKGSTCFFKFYQFFYQTSFLIGNIVFII